MQRTADCRRRRVDAEHLSSFLGPIELVEAFVLPRFVPFSFKTFDSWFVGNLHHDVNGIWTIAIPQDLLSRSIEIM